MKLHYNFTDAELPRENSAITRHSCHCSKTVPDFEIPRDHVLSSTRDSDVRSRSVAYSGDTYVATSLEGHDERSEELENLLEQRNWELGLLKEFSNEDPRKGSRINWRSKKGVLQLPGKPEPTYFRKTHQDLSGIEEIWPRPSAPSHFHSFRGQKHSKKTKKITSYIQAFKSLFNKSITSIVPQETRYQS